MDVKPISLCDYLVSYKYFLLVVIHYILDCSTKQNLCSLSRFYTPVSLGSLPAHLEGGREGATTLSCILAPKETSFTPRLGSSVLSFTLYGGGVGEGGW